MLKSTQRLLILLLVFHVVASPILAQQRRNPPPKKPAAAEVNEPPPTFDTLLAADSYRVYVEVRAVGGLIRSAAVNDLLDPVMKLGGPPKEFKTLVKWLNAHAEPLAGSRMMVAAWPSSPQLPTVLAAIEFSSPEEAKKFYPELGGFLPTLLPTPTPSPTSASTQTPPPGPPGVVPQHPAERGMPPASGRAVVPMTTQKTATLTEKETAAAPPPYKLKQTGSLVFVSNTDFTFRNLKPRGSKPLEEDQNFILARNRFAAESIFLYVDLKAIEKEEKDRQRKWEEEEQKRRAIEAANPPRPEASPEIAEAEVNQPSPEEQPPAPEPAPSSQPTLVVTASDPQVTGQATLSASPAPDITGPMMFSFYSALFGGETKWPEAISAALVFEGDAYVARTLIVNGSENKSNAIPFVPQFVSGPALVPESPNIFPADTDLFVSVSLDYPQVYDGMVKAIANAEEQSRKYRSQPAKDNEIFESPIAAYEKKLGLKIKDDVLPLLGNEIALALPKRSTAASPGNPEADKVSPDNSGQSNPAAATPDPVIAISVKDREAVAKLIPRIIESLGFKGANLFAQTEKREGVEMTSYANLLAYAFVGDFLIVSANVAATRHVVDAYLNHQTLSSDSHFRNFTRWQPRQVLGQVYVAPGLVEQYTAGTRTSGSKKMNEFVARVNPVIDPLTYALSNDGQGPLHEMHVPKNLLQLLIAGVSNEAGQAPAQANEAAAKSTLRIVASAEATYQATKGDGRYGSVDELIAENLISKDLLQRYGYRIEVTVSAKGFEATALPVAYGESGRLSYFIDETGVLRAGDHAGGAATVADSPAQ
jgi:hypothetical protein